MSHTPGPWAVFHWHKKPGIAHIAIASSQKAYEGEIATLFSSECNEANARLIAAAPELLAALKELVASELAPYPSFEEGRDAQNAWSDRRAKARNDATFVIAKAEGQS